MSGGPGRIATLLLAAFAAWALVTAIAAWTGLGGRYSLHPEDLSLASPPAPLELSRAESRLEPFEAYAAVGLRPLFNSDRLPLPQDGDEGEEGEEEELAAPEPLDITLTSVIVTPDVKIALFTENKSKTSHSLREGEEMEGEFAGWKLVQLEARRAVFEGPAGRSEVDLRVFDGRGGQAPTAAPRPRAEPEGEPADEADASEAPEDGEPKQEQEDSAEMTPESRAEMIRRRIEERRRQLREQAQRENE